MADIEKYIGESPIKNKPKRKINFVLGEKVIKSKHIGDREVTPRKLSPEVELDWLMPILNEKCKFMLEQIAELRQLVTSYSKNGLAVSNNFGSDKNIGISQWRFTREVADINNRINELFGLPGKGICVTITPDVFVSEADGEVQVTVKAGDDIFEKVRIYVNDELAIEKEYTEGFIGHLTLSETSCIRTVVQIMGVEYTDLQIVTKLFPFFIGSGTVWGDAMTVEDAQVYRGQLRGSYNMTVHNEDDKIYVIIPTRLQHQMIRIDMNGIEVPVTIHEDGELLIYESVNQYQAGRYNLDITCNCNCHPNEGTESESTEENNG